jgi:hypothetical protein
MNRRRDGLALALLLLLLPLLSAGPASAADPTWHPVTVITVDGQRHENVRVTWKLDGFLLRLRAADRTVTDLNPRVVANIVDAAGRDITREVADASPSTAGFAVLGDLRSEPFRLGWALDAGGSAGLTGGYGGFEPSGAWFAGLRRGLGTRFHLRAQYRNQHVREQVPPHGATLGTWSDEAALLLGYRPVHPRRNSNLVYLELGPTLVRWRETHDAETGFLTGGSRTKPGLLLRGGVVFPVSRRLGLDLGGLVSARPPLAEGQGTVGWVLGLNLALVVR